MVESNFKQHLSNDVYPAACHAFDYVTLFVKAPFKNEAAAKELLKGAVAGLVSVAIQSVQPSGDIADNYAEAKLIPMANNAAVLKDLFASAFQGSVISSALNGGKDLELLVAGIEYFIGQYPKSYSLIGEKWTKFIGEGLGALRSSLNK